MILTILIGMCLMGALYTSISLIMRATASIVARKSNSFHGHTLIVVILWGIIYILMHI